MIEHTAIPELLVQVKNIIEDSKQNAAQVVNVVVSAMNWRIGDIIKTEVLKNERAEYGKKVIGRLSENLTSEYGKGWSTQQLRHCLRTAETFPNYEKFSALSRELSWTHFKTIIYLKNDLAREFYIQLARKEKWSSRTLRKKIDSMLFERTSISKKPDETIRAELANLNENGVITPELVFRDPYFLNFLGLRNKFSESNLEDAILSQMEQFILELGVGFTFVERQKRMNIDGEDFRLDLLFYHRKLKRLIAIELRLGKFKAQHKGQMELYLRYLQKYEMEEGEQAPMGLILCSEGSKEQVELLQLEKSGIRVAEYLIELPPKEVLEKKLSRIIGIETDKLKERE